MDRRWLMRAGWLVAAAVLTGCVQTPTTPDPPFEGTPLSGRLALKVDADTDAPARSWSAAFELRGNETLGRLSLISPLGTVVARADWSADGATLLTPDGSQRFDSLDQLAQAAMGEALPLAALTHWLAGHPWPGAPAQATPQGFDQLGWHIDLSRWSDDASLVARREQPLPAITVRARLDR